MRRQHAAQWAIFPLAGWLFTDLLLALAMIFLVTSANGAIPIQPTPTPVPMPCLELNPQYIPFTVDYQGLLNGSSSAIAGVQHIMLSFGPIQGREAGLVLTYPGTPADDAYDTTLATNVGMQVDAVLQSLGKTGFVFRNAAFHSPLLLDHSDFSTIHLEIYLFALPGHCASAG